MKVPPDVQAVIDAALAGGAAREVRVRADLLAGGPAPAPELAAGLRGKRFEAAVIDLARSRGWRVGHFRPVRVQRKDGSVYHETPVGADGKGFPDLVCVRDRLLFLELKAGKNVVEPDQRAWLDALGRAGVEWYVFRPAEWAAIAEVLA